MPSYRNQYRMFVAFCACIMLVVAVACLVSAYIARYEDHIFRALFGIGLTALGMAIAMFLEAWGTVWTK